MNIFEHAKQFLLHIWGEVDDVVLVMFVFLTTAPMEKRIELIQPLINEPLVSVTLEDVYPDEPNHLIIKVKTEQRDGTIDFSARDISKPKNPNMLN